MGVQAFSAVVDMQELSPIEKVVLYAIADGSSGDDPYTLHQSEEQIMRFANLSRAAMRRNIEKLQDKGYIKVLAGGWYHITPGEAS